MMLNRIVPVALLLTAAVSGASSTAEPDAVDWESLCDQHSKTCVDVSPEALGGVAPNGIVLLQPAVPASYLADADLPAPAPSASSHEGGHGHGGDRGRSSSEGEDRRDRHGRQGGHGDEDGEVGFEASAEVGLLGASASASLQVEAEAPDAPDAPTLPSTQPSTPGEQIECGDPRGCPDLIVDSTRLLRGGQFTQTFAEDDCNVLEGSTEAGARKLLRFTFTTPNFGLGDLVVGDPLDLGEQWFEWGECHGHWHFREYADYRLWTVSGFAMWQAARAEDPNAMASQVLADNPDLQEHFIAGHKQGFCVIDFDWYDPFAPQRYTHCFDQGISRGWADEYSWLLDGQFIDVTDVAPGLYVLEAEVNSERLYEEMDYANNMGAIMVAVS